MLHPSERRAEDLYRLLSAAIHPGTEFIVKYEANHCRVKNEASSCRIVCFDTHSGQSEQAEARYDINCQRWVDGVPRDRTVGYSSSQSEIVAAVVCWMEGQTVEAFHEHFPFMGKLRRLYASIEEGILRYSPELAAKTTYSINDLSAFSEGYELLFSTPTRWCRICPSYYGDAATEPRCVFYWNRTRVPFEFPIRDLNQSAQVVKRWLCDNAMPSQLRVEFPALTTGAVADAYEATRLIGECLESWDSVEDCYRRWQYAPTCEVLTPSIATELLTFVADIRRAGFDRTLYGSTSHLDLFVSRSPRHRLRDDEPWIRFEFRGAGISVYADTRIGGIRFPEIKFTPAVAKLLSWVEADI